MTSYEKINSIVQRAKFKFPVKAKEDLVNVLANFMDLQPHLVDFTFPDGITRNCLSLEGTIPIRYKGSKYNIPVALYLLDNHPYSGPYCYVKPTSSMRVRSSKTVDTSGRIYLPYLTEWNFPSYDTSGLLQVMTYAFEDKCPVYSVSSEPTSGSTTNSNHSNSNHHSNSTSYPISNAKPPYPTSGGGGIHQPPTPPVLPPYPTADPPPHLMPQPNVAHGSAGYPPPSHYQPYPSADRSTPPVYPPQQPTPPVGTGYGYPTGTIQPTHIRASLLSAVEDKIRQKLRDKIGTPFAELQSIDANLKELHSGKQQLREMLDNVARDKQELDRILAIYTSKKEELERALQAANANGTANGTALNVEDAIDAPTPVHRQILDCYVKDCSIDDTIYCLGQALKKGTINLQIYLKYVRQLSHQQFVQRLLMQKCREKARLPL